MDGVKGFFRTGGYSLVKDDEESLIAKPSNDNQSLGIVFKAVTLIVIFYCISELVCAMYVDVSLTLLVDGFRNLSDVISLLIIYQAQKTINQEPNKSLSFGWIRMETLGGLMNGFFLLALCLYTALEAIPRFVEPQSLAKDGQAAVIVVACFGLLVTGLKAIAFKYGVITLFNDTKEINVKFKSHVFRDVLISVIILISGALLGLEWRLTDPTACLTIIGLLAISTTRLVKQDALTLLQAAPSDVDIPKLRNEIGGVRSVLNVHELHVWRLTDSMVLASVHLTCEKGSNIGDILHSAKQIFHSHGIHSVTIQPDFSTKSQNKFCSENCIQGCDADWCCKKLADLSLQTSNLNI